MISIHIRRGDKLIREAKFIDSDEYMFWAELYFRKIEIKGKKVKRIIYIATDETGLVEKMRKKHSQYQFITNEDFPFIPNSKRHSKEKTEEIFRDIYYLSKTDYLICTFSSNLNKILFWCLASLRLA
ncbi:hypothetical protein MXB_687 [Myxobolus squamalis]|nr:hypothetical protein MXB_687 [Myxobolus squamalis]